jgi:hypothetical protein
VTSAPANQQDHLARRLRALVLGAVDMWDVFNVARYLLGDDSDAPPPHPQALPMRVRRALEAGMVITYARPFLVARGRGSPKLSPANGLGPELKASHDELLRRRNSVYAHNDETPLRQILELADQGTVMAWVERSDGKLSEEWHSPTDGVLEDLVRLATLNLERFTDDAEGVKQRLSEFRDAVSRPNDTP